MCCIPPPRTADTCRYSLANNITVTTSTGVITKSPTFQSYGTGKLVFRVAQLGLDYWSAAGVKVSFALRKDRPCNTVETFLVDARYSIFDKVEKCCPIFGLYGKK